MCYINHGQEVYISHCDIPHDMEEVLGNIPINLQTPACGIALIYTDWMWFMSVKFDEVYILLPFPWYIHSTKKCKNKSCRDALPPKTLPQKPMKQVTMHTAMHAQTTHTSQRNAAQNYDFVRVTWGRHFFPCHPYVWSTNRTP